MYLFEVLKIAACTCICDHDDIILSKCSKNFRKIKVSETKAVQDIAKRGHLVDSLKLLIHQLHRRTRTKVDETIIIIFLIGISFVKLLKTHA